MLDEKLEKLIVDATDNPNRILELGAQFIVVSASSNPSQINHYLLKVSTVLEKHTDVALVQPLLAGIEGVAFFYLTKYKKAEQKLLMALDQIQINTPDDVEGFVRCMLGANYRSLGEIDLAVENELLATSLLDKNGLFKIYYAYSYYQLGEIHLAIDEYENAKSYYEEALSVVSLSDQTTANFRVNDGLGLCYMHLKEYDNALIYLNKSLAIEGISLAEEARGLCDLGILYIALNRVEEAIELFIKSYEIRNENKLEDASSTSLIQLGQAYLNNNNPKKAIVYLKKAEEIVTKFNALAKKIKVLQLLGEGYHKLGKNEEAITYFMKYDELNENVRSEQKRKIFNLKNKQIESQKQKLASQNLQLNDTLDQLHEAKNSKASLFYSIITAIILVILSEAFLDPFIESYNYNIYLSIGAKIIIALLLKPMESFYERILYKKAMKKRVDKDVISF